MSEINEVVMIPDEMLNSVVGGALTDEGRALILSVTQSLKNNGLLYNNAIAWLREQTAGYRMSDEDWQEVVEIVKSVYES